MSFLCNRLQENFLSLKNIFTVEVSFSFFSVVHQRKEFFAGVGGPDFGAANFFPMVFNLFPMVSRMSEIADMKTHFLTVHVRYLGHGIDKFMSVI